MQASDLYKIFIYLALLIALSPPLGSYLYYVFNAPMSRLERYFYRITRTSVNAMNWKQYLSALLLFQGLGFLSMMLLLGFNQRDHISIDLAFNTALSFITNTNWQAYSGESTLDYWVQMLALTVQNFFSAATSIAVLFALIRGITGKETDDLGNFWVDITRIISYVLLPFSVLISIFLVSQGAIQNFSDYIPAIGLEGVSQLLPMGPAASQTAIAVLGSNGGGFFGQNAAHPFVNPNELSNFLLMFTILILPAGLVYFYGLQVGSKKHACAIFSVMLTLFVFFLAGSFASEIRFGSLEGQEIRFGQLGSVLFGSAATASSNGSVNAMMDSLSPLAGGLMMLQMMLGEIIFGGVGCGLYGMLLFVMFTVFLAGLMVGRTPEYLGKKIEASEINWILVGILAPCIVILIGAGISCLAPIALQSLGNSGPHGLSEILYAFTSSANNNGSAFSGLAANTSYWNWTLGLAMLIGRFGLMIPVLVIAGSLARKKQIPMSLGTFQTDTPMFAVLLGASILLVGALTFMPGWFLGPLLEHISLVGALR
ncbi:MAG: potassium-transporting ATPase subunit KdpA [Myxococcaceae bacterium]